MNSCEDREAALLQLTLDDLRRRASLSSQAFQHNQNKLAGVELRVSELREHLKDLRTSRPVVLVSEFQAIRKSFFRLSTELQELRDAQKSIQRGMVELRSEIRSTENQLQKAKQVLESRGKILRFPNDSR